MRPSATTTPAPLKTSSMCELLRSYVCVLFAHVSRYQALSPYPVVPLSVGVNAGYPAVFGKSVGVSGFGDSFEVDVGPLFRVFVVGILVEL